MKEGELYLVGGAGQVRPHWWIVLQDPDDEGRFLSASFTDARAYRANDDVWRKDMAITESFRLEKDSVIAVRFTKVWTVEEMSRLTTERGGTCNEDVLLRARCNLAYFKKQLSPKTRIWFEQFEDAWCEDCWEDS